MTPRNAMIERSKKTHPVLRRRTNPTLRRPTYASTEGNAGKYAKEGRSTNGHARKSKWPEGGRHNDEPFRRGGPNEEKNGGYTQPTYERRRRREDAKDFAERKYRARSIANVRHAVRLGLQLLSNRLTIEH